jgi:hypothetical protein
MDSKLMAVMKQIGLEHWVDGSPMAQHVLITVGATGIEK